MIDVPRETSEQLTRFTDLVTGENERQNLIARSTLTDMWQRHIIDSLQLLDHAKPGPWLDIGTGAGFPGMVIAVAEPDRPVTMVEPRARRAAFLVEAAARLGLSKVSVITAKVESIPSQAASVISARAVAALDVLLTISLPHAAPGCRWLLPKGRGAAEELATARRTWQGHFTLVSSITDPEASIVMAEDVRPLGKRR